MSRFVLFILTMLFAVLLIAACGDAGTASAEQEPIRNAVKPADSFAYPVSKAEYVTQARDKKDGWYNALDFGENNHLGEDWNGRGGGNTDCGEPVYAIANGVITYAADAGPRWGNVVIVTHSLADGSKVQSLYGHMQEILKTSGEVSIREKIGSIGDANGKYLCHLHFELRESHNPMWDMVFAGYSPVNYGWTDPSDFIDQRRQD